MIPPAISANSLFSAQAPSLRNPGWVELANVVVCISKIAPDPAGTQTDDPATPGPTPSNPISRCQGDVIFREWPPSLMVFLLICAPHGRPASFFLSMVRPRFFRGNSHVAGAFLLGVAGLSHSPFDLWQACNKLLWRRRSGHSGSCFRGEAFGPKGRFVAGANPYRGPPAAVGCSVTRRVGM